jgi:small conductance mechanosensitive channel
MKGATDTVRRRELELILIVLADLVVAWLVRFLVNLGVLPEVYILPIYAAIILVGGYLVIMVVNQILERIIEPTFGATRTRGLKNLFELLAAIVIIVLVFAIFGVNLTAALVGAGFLGIVLGLAAQQVLGNIFAGLSLLVSKPFEIGDHVKLATSSYGLTGSSYSHESEASGFTGVVKDVGIFFTRLLMDDGHPAVFPNSVVIGSLIVNYSKINSRAVRVRMDLDRKIDYDRFKSRLLESLKKYEVIEGERSSMEIVDVAATTYQVVTSVWAKSESDEPIRTLVIREGMKVQDELSGTKDLPR